MKTKLTFVIATIIFGSITNFGQSNYKQPPKAIMDALNAPAIPNTVMSPSSDKIAMLEPLRYPPIADLAQPMLRLAGTRFNPVTNGPHLLTYAVKIRFKNVGDGKELELALPPNAKVTGFKFSPDGRHAAFGNITNSGVELWIVDTATGKANRVKNVFVNTAFGGFDWENANELSASLVPAGRGPAPAYQNITPDSPNIQETTGRRGSIATFQDLLKSPNDEKLYEYYATSQIALIDITGKVRNVGQPAIFADASFSPDGKYVFVGRVQRPYSYLVPASRFPRKVEVWDATGKLVQSMPDTPLLDNLPSQGVPTGARNISWIPTEPSTLIWAEALDGGDPRNKVTPRDKLMTLSAPFNATAKELLRTENRFQGRAFGERDGLLIYYDYNRDTQKRRMFVTDYRNPSSVKQVYDLNINDRYADIGTPVTKLQPSGVTVIRQHGDDIFLTGVGATPQGDRPFLRRMNLKTLKIEELFRSGVEEYEAFAGMISDDGTKIFTRKESVTAPPNVYTRSICNPKATCETTATKITDFKDPAPQLREITKQLVKYKRADGVELSFTLYLPPGYKEGTKLPTIVWAYPESYTDASLAGQVSGSTNKFTQIGGISHLFLLLQGYAILDNASMPIIGPPETKNDTFVKQIVDAAQAAIDKGAELGVVDRDRVGVGGHSYGAFMTANLLAHSDMFRAGVARSGAYNRTLTPFGFQDEVRNFWDATKIYTDVSPFFYANKINEPVLLIHGEADNNQGTFPIQSERLFAAIQGNGGTARLVMLPFESHGYSGKESVEHTLYEMVSWFDKYVKNAKPREQQPAEPR